MINVKWQMKDIIAVSINREYEPSKNEKCPAGFAGHFSFLLVEQANQSFVAHYPYHIVQFQGHGWVGV